MNLNQYKEKYNLKNSDLAKLFKVSQSCVHNWIKGYVKPSGKHAFTICKKTKGEITLEALGLV
jgi:DNA-binding transcriptional regulator YdaS (Cro superfamily)